MDGMNIVNTTDKCLYAKKTYLSDLFVKYFPPIGCKTALTKSGGSFWLAAWR